MASTDLNNVATYCPEDPSAALRGVLGGVYVGTLTGTLTLTNAYPSVLKLDPGGANRDVTLDVIATHEGCFRHIINAADAAENLVVKNPAGSTIATINQNEEGLFYCDGAAWILIRIATIALS